MLSRVSWPLFPLGKVLDALREASMSGVMKRVCIQTLNYPGVLAELQALVKAVQHAKLPISVSCQPHNIENVKQLVDAGVERLGIPLDAATEELFDEVKGESVQGPYEWTGQFQLLEEAVSILGSGMVTTHLIVGLGETEEEMINAMQKCVDMGVLPALFAFTPIHGTALENRAQPSIRAYRRLQVARSLITQGIKRLTDMHFNEEEKLVSFGVDKHTLANVIRKGMPFLTSGCPDCNRPFYNEKPSGPIYNYPRDLAEKELSSVRKELGIDGA